MHILYSLFYNHLIIYNSSGELSEEEEVLQWLITQKTEDRIELITRQMLETMVEETQYLAVYFCKLQIEMRKTLFHNVTQYKLLSPGTTTAPLHRRTTLHHQHQTKSNKKQTYISFHKPNDPQYRLSARASHPRTVEVSVPPLVLKKATWPPQANTHPANSYKATCHVKENVSQNKVFRVYKSQLPIYLSIYLSSYIKTSYNQFACRQL